MGIFDGQPKQALTPAEQYAQDDAMRAAYEQSKVAGQPVHNGAVLGAPATDQQMADKGYDVPIPGSPPPDAPTFPGVPGSGEAGQNAADGTRLAMALRKSIFQRMPVGGAPAGVVQGPGEDYSREGGAHGKSDWEDTFVTKPAQIEQAMMEGADVEGQYGKAKEDYYKRLQSSQGDELAILQSRRIAHQQEIEAQQAKIQQATESYSNDLADRGQFWKNPLHIVGAIGAAMMALGSGGPTIGVKLINDAVTADFNERKQLANMHLGELRSNLGSYRQIAGDKELGDRLALAESLRVAVMEGDRIAAQFQGPAAKAKWAAVAKETNAQRQILMMNMYHQGVYQPAGVVDPRIAAANKAAGKALGPGAGYSPFAGAGMASVGSSGGQAQPGAMGGQGVPGALQERSGASSGQGQPANPGVYGGSISKEVIDAAERRAPGAGRQAQAEMDEIAQRIWSVSRGNPATFNDKMEAFQQKQEDDIKGIAVAAQPIVAKINGYRRLGDDIGLIKVMADRLHTDPDSLLGSGTSAIMGKEFMAKYRDTMHLLGNTDPAKANKYATEVQETENAVERFKQVLAGNQNTYIHDKSGGNVSANENLRMKEYLRQGFRGISAFHDNESKLAQAEFDNATNSAAHPVSGTLYRAQMGMGSASLDRKGISGPETGEMNSAQEAGLQSKRDADEGARQQRIQKAIQNAKGR